MSETLDTAKKRKFAQAYIINPNGTEAARTAGYEGNDATLATTAYRLLRDKYVIDEVERGLQQFAMGAAEVLIHLTDIARGDLADCLDDNGNVDIRKAKQMGKTHLIKKFKQKSITASSEDGSVGADIVMTQVEMYDRLRALDLLAKYHNLTNRIKVDDWRSELLALLKEGKVTYELVAGELGEQFTREFIESASVPSLNAGEDSPAES